MEAVTTRRGGQKGQCSYEMGTCSGSSRPTGALVLGRGTQTLTKRWLGGKEEGKKYSHSSPLPCSGFLVPPTGQKRQMSEGKKARVVAVVRGTSGPPGRRAQQRRAEDPSMK